LARIRSVKPEFFTSETIAALSVPARLTFVGLWTHADDYGRALDNPKLLKAAVWPLDDDVSAGQVAAHLDEFGRAGLVCRYQVGGKRYLHVTAWSEHQRPKNPAAERIPACPKPSHGGDDPGDGLPQEDPSPTPALPQDGDRPSPPRARARSREQVAGSREVGGGAGSREGGTGGKPVGTQAADAPSAPQAVVINLAKTAAERDAQRLCDRLADRIHAWSGERPNVGKRWLDAARLLITKDGYTPEQVDQLIDWATESDFWRPNILSMPKLREKRLTLIGQSQRDQRPRSGIDYAFQRAAEARAREAGQP
jgi:hypothetical protein